MFERILIIAIATILIASFVGFAQVWYRIRLGAELTNNSIPYQQDGTGVKRILFAGDSLTVGVGTSNQEDSIAGRFGNEFPNYTIHNVGVSGLRLAEFPKTLEKSSGQYDLVIMQIGANDVLRLYNLEKLESDAVRAVKAAKGKSTNVVWMTSGNIGATEFFPWPLNYYYDSRTRKSREVFLKVAKEENILYVDLFTSVEDDPFINDIKKYYSRDKLHLSSDGYAIWFEQMRREMKDSGISI